TFFTAAFLATTFFTAAFLATTFFTAAFLATTGFDLAASALFNAHRFFVAATIAALLALLNLRFGFGVAGAGGSAPPLIAAHRFFCASAMWRRAAALRFLVG